VVALVLAIAGLGAAYAPSASAATYAVWTGSNIRSAPNTSSSIVGSLASGQSVSIDCYVNGENVSGNSLWDHLTSGGYVADYLVNTGSNNPVVPLCGSSTNTSSKTYPVWTGANIRSGSNTSSSVIGSRATGQTVTIDCYVNGENVSGNSLWDHLTSGGYVADYLVNTGSNNPVVPLCGGIASATSTGAKSYPVFNSSSIRGGPGTDYAIVNSVSAGTRLSIDCYVTGESVSGSTIWNHVTSGGFIADPLINTGTTSSVVPSCTGTASTTITAPNTGVGNATYNRDAAVTYAVKHWSDPQTYGADCTFFASNVLWAGGLPRSTSWFRLDVVGPSGYPILYTYSTRAANNANALVIYLVNQSLATKQRLSWTQNAVPYAAVGDIIAYDWETDGTIDHLSVITSFTTDSYPKVTQHTAAQLNRGWTWSIENNTWITYVPGSEHASAYLVHITR